MFRMKYESCSGQCYAYSDVLRVHTLGLDEDGTVSFLKRLLAIHGPACGNQHLAFRLDHDEDLGIFVASFERYGSLDLFADRTPLGALNKMIDGVLSYYQSEEYANDYRRQPGLGRGVCRHGSDDALVNFALAFSGLSVEQQSRIRNRFWGPLA